MNKPTAAPDVSQELAARFEALRIAYERFIVGLDRGEPSALRKQFLLDLRRALTRPPNNTAQNFRLQAIKARMLTYEAMWDRTLVAKESSGSRLQRGPKGAPGAPDATQAPSAAPTASSALQSLYETYVAASAEAQVRPPSYEAFSAMVNKQTATIQARTGWQDVGLRVTDKDGRPALQAFRRS